MKPSSKNEPVIREKKIIVPLDPAHKEKPTLVERERIEKEQAEKEENQLTDQQESDPADEEDQSEKDKERKREKIIR